MTVYRRMEILAQRIATQCRGIDKGSIERFITLILDAKRIFVVGAGRSGLVARAFGMRLMHLGFVVYVVGETTTPAIAKGDLIIAVSGSGKTASVFNVVKVAKEMDVRIAAVTSHPETGVGKLADCVVRIKGRVADLGDRDYIKRQVLGNHEPMTPLGTIFELSSLLFLDAVVEELMVRQNKSEKHMMGFHTNLE